MKITKVTDDGIYFDNGNYILDCHDVMCCEYNYADYSQLEEIALETEFDEELIFEEVKYEGFRFGNEGKMFFVPCYSEQNGYYSSDVNILYNGKKVLVVDAPLT